MIGEAVEINQSNGAGRVETLDSVRKAPFRSRWPMPSDCDFDGYDTRGREILDCTFVASVDRPDRQMKQKVDDPRSLTFVILCAQQRGDRFFQPRTDAFQTGNVCKQRIEYGGTQVSYCPNSESRHDVPGPCHCAPLDCALKKALNIMANSTHKLHLRRKLLLWRASHRGTREMDVLLGGFARDNIDSMQPSELDELERLIDVPDPELMSWIVGEAAVREEYRNSVTERLLAYRVRLV